MLRFFIVRPILSSVISIIIILCGLASILQLPLSEYPNIAPPTITINARYPSANAEVVQKTIASPIEQQVNGVSQMIYMNSTMSSNGNYNLVVTFATGTDLNTVIGDLLNRLNAAIPMLPPIVQNLGVTMRKSSQNLLMSIVVQADNNDLIYLSNYVYRTIYTELLRINGIGDIAITGVRNYAMRIFLYPDKMAKLNVSLADVENAIKEQNIQVSGGQTAAPPILDDAVVSINLIGQGYYSTPQQFENIIIRNNSNSYVRIKDIARVELGAFDYDNINKFNGKSTIGLQLFLDPSANQIIVHDKVLSVMQKLSKQFPHGVSYQLAFDNTKFIKRALQNVVHTLRDSCILVILVILLFLQNLRTALIPILTIPVAVIGTFAGMYATNFSINNLTLFGLILSIGIIVDDSIVVIENIERTIQESMITPLNAAIQAMREVSGALIAIILVLCCAFIPATFLSGLTGILYKQFAITISIAVIISGIVALTLTPALYVLLSKYNFKIPRYINFIFTRFNQYFTKFSNLYIALVTYMLNNTAKCLWVFLIIVVSTIAMCWYIPTGFIPNEDKGFFLTQVSLHNNASLKYTERVTDDYVNYLLQDKNIENALAIIGIDQVNSNATKNYVSTVTADLIDWDDRNMSIDEIIERTNLYNTHQKDAKYTVIKPFAIDGMGNTDGIEFYLQDKINGNYFHLAEVAEQIIQQLNQESAVERSYYVFNPNNIATSITVDPTKVKFYGTDVRSVYSMLSANYGLDLVNYFYKAGDLFWVIIQSDVQYRKNQYQLNNLFVKSANNTMVPLNSLVTSNNISSPDVIERFNGSLATKITVIPKHNQTMQAMHAIEKIMQHNIPKDYSYNWYGVSYQQSASLTASIFAFAFGLIMIFLVLAGQFEMWRLPIVVMLGVPFAIFGAALMLVMRGLTNDLYFQISLITLLGLSAKNSILITEFAAANYKSGMDIYESAILAAKQRFRPIIMTSSAFILGAIPLALSHGANCNAEHSVGTGIIGGMLSSTFIATLFTPLFFVIIMKTYKHK